MQRLGNGLMCLLLFVKISDNSYADRRVHGRDFVTNPAKPYPEICKYCGFNRTPLDSVESGPLVTGECQKWKIVPVHGVREVEDLGEPGPGSGLFRPCAVRPLPFQQVFNTTLDV